LATPQTKEASASASALESKTRRLGADTTVLGTRLSIHSTHSLLEATFRVIDAACIILSLRLALIGLQNVEGQLFWLTTTCAIAIFFGLSEFLGMYRDWRGESSEQEIACGLITWTLTAVVMLLVGFAAEQLANFPKGRLFLWGVATPLLFVGSRVLIRGGQRFLRSKGFNSRQYAIVGVNPLALQLAQNVEQAPELGLRLLGFFDDRPPDRTPNVPSEIGRRVGNLDELVQATRSGNVDMIYITFPMRAEERIREVLERLADTTASVYIVPDFFVFELLHSRWRNIGGLPAVSIFENPFFGVDGTIKRIVDLVLACTLLAVLALPMVIIGLLIKLTSPGPIFFRQHRYGLDGQQINVWKFRSMRVCENGDEVAQATRHDNRVTPIGSFLRRTSLDEVPQLFNVVLGSMSLVGPRPHATAHNEQYRQAIHGYMLRHKVKPGITGLAQVNGCRGETDTLEKMQQRIDYDHRYIREWSLWLDLKILVQTIGVVVSCENAY
jgi:putative colanic acid biosynthesis UDP-glucose lipid carrier transferase